MCFVAMHYVRIYLCIVCDALSQELMFVGMYYMRSERGTMSIRRGKYATDDLTELPVRDAMFVLASICACTHKLFCSGGCRTRTMVSRNMARSIAKPTTVAACRTGICIYERNMATSRSS